MSDDAERLAQLAADIAYVEAIPLEEAIARLARALTEPVKPLRKTGP